ncbi:BrnA antitoxin family protein [Methylorubrum extorquens]|uniref:Uncharacterized protein n=1 Tax=Methylorubrum extorquens DSM 13060 TaxID=882800 RepID=H1KGA5_METEX|nr:hypothetical protein MetexDRAFT_1667 [Methylorubrum extorquens DSM 13060]
MSNIARTPNQASTGIPHEDWDDVDSPELTDADLAELRPASEMPAEVFALLPKRGRGRPKAENAKVNVTLRLDPRLVEAYKATGAGWQTRMQEVLAGGLPSRERVARERHFMPVHTNQNGIECLNEDPFPVGITVRMSDGRLIKGEAHSKSERISPFYKRSAAQGAYLEKMRHQIVKTKRQLRRRLDKETA